MRMRKELLLLAGNPLQRTSFHSKAFLTDIPPNFPSAQLMQGATAVKPSEEFNEACTEHYGTEAEL